MRREGVLQMASLVLVLQFGVIRFLVGFDVFFLAVLCVPLASLKTQTLSAQVKKTLDLNSRK